MIKDKYRLILICLILAGVALRLFWLTDYPVGFFRDEAALGYNAYSIWQTGRDEYGVFLPLVFRSFEVFFLPAYVYLTAPIVGVLGLSELSTRLLASLAGVALLILTYFIAKEIWDKRIAIFSVLVLVTSPWHIFYSRGTFEGNLALALFSAGFLFWLKFTKKNKVLFFFLSLSFFAASMYAYQAQRLIVPLFGLVAASLIFRKLWKIKTKLILPAVIMLILLTPLIFVSSKASGYHRARGVSIFAKEGKPPGWIQQDGPGVLINNELYLRIRQVTALYLSYFSPRNLFIEGDYDRQRSVENFSVFYAWLLPFLVLGLWRAIRERASLGVKLFLAWMFLAPLPAALTGDPFHTYRSLLLYLPLSCLMGLGLAKSLEFVRNRRSWFLAAIALVSIGSVVSFLFSYLVLNQATRARAWDYGYKEMVNFVNTLSAGTRVVVDDPGTEAYIHFLFFGRVDPTTYQAEVAKLGLVESYYYNDSSEIRPNKLGSFEFRPVDWPAERGDSGTVFIMAAQRLPVSEFETDPRVLLLKEITYPDGQPAFRIVKIL